MANTLTIPTRKEIETLAIGDLALDSFGNMAEVVEICARREDINNTLFVCYYTRCSETSQCSMSMKAGELVRHAGLKYTSHELDRIEGAFMGVFVEVDDQDQLRLGIEKELDIEARGA